jgi:hypothetical protein
MAHQIVVVISSDSFEYVEEEDVGSPVMTLILSALGISESFTDLYLWIFTM